MAESTKDDNAKNANIVELRGQKGYIVRVAKIAGGAEYTVVVNDENDETPVSSGPSDEDYTHNEEIRLEKSGAFDNGVPTDEDDEEDEKDADTKAPAKPTASKPAPATNSNVKTTNSNK